MSITLVTTVAGTTSNAYADETYYDTYFESNLIFTSLWSGLTDEQKKARIVEAVKALDVLVPEYDGIPYIENQNLEFPRDIGDNRFPATSIHRRIKEAVGEIIVYQYFKKDSTTGEIDSREIQKVGAVNGLVNVEYKEGDFEYSVNKVAGGSIERVRGLMSPWISTKKLKRT